MMKLFTCNPDILKITSILYQTFLAIYRSAPFKPFWARLIRWLPINIDRFYKDLHFNGVFTVHTKSSQFKIHHLETSIENELFWKGLDNSLERDTMWLWVEFCKTSSVIVDIGANTGVYSLVAKTENPDATVIAFEPSAKIFPKLQDNVRINNLKICCEQIAISNSDKTQTFYELETMDFPTSGSLNSGKLKDLEKGRKDILEYPLQCNTLDNYVDQNKTPNIDLVKIDVELHEPEVFDGFTMLQKLRPVIFVEILTDKVAKEIINASNLEGYRFFKLIDLNKVVEVKEIVADSEHRNYLLLPKERNLPDNYS